MTGTDVVKGGPGNDLVYGGNTSALNGGGGFAKYLYGDDGDDKMWGSVSNEFEYMWGGEGDDVITGGRDTMNTFINGNEGDDVIYPASGTTVEDRVRGGKGDDIINPVTLVFDDTGMQTTDLTSPDNQAALSVGGNWQGGEGNDTIYGAYKPTSDAYYLGGNGDDTIYG